MGKKFEKYQVLILFVGLTLVGWGIHFFAQKDGWLLNIWGALDVSFAVSMGVIAFLAYLEFIKAEDEIKIYFEIEGELKDTGLSLLRKDCTRGEILGVLGMIQKDSIGRYNLLYMKNREMLQELHTIQKGKKNRVVIPMSSDELKQFDV